MKNVVIAAVMTLLTMGVLDAIWLTTMTSRLYRRELGDLLLATPAWAPAFAFYLLYAVGTLILIVLPALRGDWTLSYAMLMGALLGAVAYGTYDLTNLATLRGWSVTVSALDIAWGALLTSVTVGIALSSARQFD